MPDTAITRTEHSIHHVHELIQMVFSRPAAETQEVLGGLMSMFAEDFSMVSTTGTVFDRQQVEQLFRQATGTRAGLQILVSEVTPVWQAGTNVAVRYTETHRFSGKETVRRSLAILECGAQGVVWRCLHETAVPSQ